MTNHIKISLQDFYNYLMSDYKDYNYNIYCHHKNKRYYIVSTYTPYCLYINYEKTPFEDSIYGKIKKQDMINELLPIVRREKINKILKR